MTGIQEGLVQGLFTLVSQEHLAHVGLVHRKWKRAGGQDSVSNYSDHSGKGEGKTFCPWTTQRACCTQLLGCEHRMLRGCLASIIFLNTEASLMITFKLWFSWFEVVPSSTKEPTTHRDPPRWPPSAWLLACHLPAVWSWAKEVLWSSIFLSKIISASNLWWTEKCVNHFVWCLTHSQRTLPNK